VPTTRDKLLSEILASPDDDGPRGVYADYLLERGDARGELIRIQCEIEKLDPYEERGYELRRRSHELLQEHMEA
jgi:uncharacterized protein (TIGR02996 family)